VVTLTWTMSTAGSLNKKRYSGAQPPVTDHQTKKNEEPEKTFIQKQNVSTNSKAKRTHLTRERERGDVGCYGGRGVSKKGRWLHRETSIAGGPPYIRNENPIDRRGTQWGNGIRKPRKLLCDSGPHNQRKRKHCLREP